MRWEREPRDRSIRVSECRSLSHPLPFGQRDDLRETRERDTEGALVTLASFLLCSEPEQSEEWVEWVRRRYKRFPFPFVCGQWMDALATFLRLNRFHHDHSLTLGTGRDDWKEEAAILWLMATNPLSIVFSCHTARPATSRSDCMIRGRHVTDCWVSSPGFAPDRLESLHQIRENFPEEISASMLNPWSTVS